MALTTKAEHAHFVRRVLERMIEMIPDDTGNDLLAKMRFDAVRAWDLMHPDSRVGTANAWSRLMEPLIREARIQGGCTTLSAVADWLNARGYEGRNGAPWSENTVKDIEHRIEQLIRFDERPDEQYRREQKPFSRPRAARASP
jgi:hypothetical protein